MRFYLIALFLVVALVTSGCATIVTGSSQSVTFNSTPKGATVKVDGVVMGVTPLTVSLKKGEAHRVKFTLTGYRPVTKQLTTSIEPWFFGNIILGGVFGSTTDAASGAIMQYSPNKYFVTLIPKKQSFRTRTLSQRVQSYIVANYDALRSAAAKPDSMSSNAFNGLMALLGIKASETYKIKDIKEILLGYKSPVDAARKLDSKYVEKN